MQYFLHINLNYLNFFNYQNSECVIDRQNCLQKELLFIDKPDGYCNFQYEVLYGVDFQF